MGKVVIGDQEFDLEVKDEALIKAILALANVLRRKVDG